MRGRQTNNHIIKRFLAMVFAVTMLLSVLSPMVAAAAGEADGAAADSAQVGAAAGTQDGAAGAQADEKDLSALVGKRFAICEGTTFEETLRESIPGDVKILQFKTTTDAIEAVAMGKVDAAVADYPVAKLAVGNHDDLAIYSPTLEPYENGWAFRKGDKRRDEFSEVLVKFKNDGTLERLMDKWTSGRDEDKTIPEQTWPGSKGEIIFTSSPDYEPVYYQGEGGQILGYDVELMLLAAKELDYHVKFVGVNFDAMMPSLASGKTDMLGGGLAIKEERKKAMDFTAPEYIGSTALIVRKDGPLGGSVEASTSADDLEFHSLKELEGRPFASIRGGIQETMVPEYLPGAQPVIFNSMADIIAAIETGKVDSFFGSVCMLEEMARENPNLGILYETLYHADCAYALRKGSGLKEKIDPILDRYREDGTLDKLDKKWRGDDESQKVIDKSGLTGENGTIRYWADGTTPPMDYTDESGELTGYEVDLMYMIARELGMKIEETVADFDALLAALASGKADAASGTITITEERQQKVDLTVPNYDDQTAALVRKAKMTTAAEQGFFESIADSFYKTFIVEDRWKMILSGLMLTVIISIASAIVGLLLGFCLCMLRRCRVKAVAKAVAIFVRIIQGTPIIVLLMILYYIIFGKVEISGAIIAIVGFAINFAAYSSEIMRSGIEAVDAGQREAALALGFTVKQSFLRVVFPQAATHFIPVLKGEFISMVKMTSVVGYIAVEDLTKISDIIRARTMDAFFPLISTAVIYFVLANLLILVITVFEKKIDVKRRPRRVKL